MPEMETANAITQFAAQTGRLDFVTSLLASISVIMVFGGLFAWINVSAKAEKVAKETAEKKAEEVANIYLQEHLPGLIEAYDNFIRERTKSVSTADQIAQAQENGKNG